MPNFQTKQLDTLEYPNRYEDVSFLWQVDNQNESLILTRVGDEQFFIKQIEKKDKILVKGDKLSKPSLVQTLQKALNAYEKTTHAKPFFSNIHTKKNRQTKKPNILKDVDFFALEFSNFQTKWEDTWIEVGFGSGRHLLYQAKTNPNILHVGIEIHKPSIEQVIKQCKLQGLNNVLIIDFDARVLLEFIASNSISRIFVHFPIPWDKKPHRRVISKEFCDEATRVLRVGGKLELRTDSDNYFTYSFEIFTAQTQVALEVLKNKDIEIISKYEERWKRRKKNIYDIILTNNEHSCVREIPKPLHFGTMDLQNFQASSIKKETILGKNWFVHFETCYTNDNKKIVWKVAFGDTAFVEHCYLMIKETTMSYFPKNIYATKNNLLAHKIIYKKFAQ